MRIDERKLRAALAPETRWPAMKRAIQQLNDAELDRAEKLERMGRRSVNALRIFRAERYQRQRVHHAVRGKMLTLKSEAVL